MQRLSLSPGIQPAGAVRPSRKHASSKINSSEKNFSGFSFTPQSRRSRCFQNARVLARASRDQAQDNSGVGEDTSTREPAIFASVAQSRVPENEESIKSEPDSSGDIVEKVRQKQLALLAEQQESERKGMAQLELQELQKLEWKRALLRPFGFLRGTQWDPLPGAPMKFNDFWGLVLLERVQFLDYAEHGKDIAVILPHPAESLGLKVVKEEEGVVASSSRQTKGPKQQEEVDAPLSEEAENTPAGDPEQVVYLRHPVVRMPAGIHSEMWGPLREQLVHVAVSPPATASIPTQVLPTFLLASTWALRFGVALLLFRLLDHLLLPFYSPKSLEERPRSSSRKMTAVLDPNLGLMGQSRARFISAEERTGITFEDFAGQDYVKRELQEVVRILKDAKEFEELGVYCPKGVMLFGPPGTGKTLLAKAIAGEAGVPFFSVSGAEFVEMFAGVAASRVKDLFARARNFSPSIIFIDEIDAIGVKRGSGTDMGGGSIEREQGLIQILTELDGFQESQAKVLVIGATNRLDMLDPALLRKGRFDKVVRVGLPNEEGRYAILQVHARNKQFLSPKERDRLLKEIATLTQDFSGAELMNVLNEASILAVRKEKDMIERPELLQAIDRQAGEFKTGEEDLTETEEGRVRAAYREAAIAVLDCCLPDPSRPLYKTNIEDLDPLPNMEYAKVRHRTFFTKGDMINAIVRSLAAPLVEPLVFGEEQMSWQSGVNLGEASQLADFLIFQSGMSALGAVHYRTDKDLMHHLVPKVVALRDEYMRYAVQRCSSYLNEYRSAVETIAEALLEKNELFAEEIWSVFNATPRIAQPPVQPIDEYAVLMRNGRWGIYGLSLPGRATFSPGNIGYATFGAPRPRQMSVISSSTWEAMDELWQQRLQELAKMSEEDEEEEGEGGGEEEDARDVVPLDFIL